MIYLNPVHRFATIAVISTGSLTLLTSVYGLYLSCQSLAKALRGGFAESISAYHIVDFYYWFYPMLSVSLVCSVLLILCALDQVRIRFTRLKLFIAVIVFELLYFIFLGTVLWPSSNGLSVGAATGAASNGLWAPYLILLPFWAPFVLLWAKRRLA
jgi:hypothetical protein